MTAKKHQPCPADYKGPTVQRPSVLPPAPPRACRNHSESPVKGYSQCVGCEVERLNKENKRLREQVRYWSRCTWVGMLSECPDEARRFVKLAKELGLSPYDNTSEEFIQSLGPQQPTTGF